MEPSRSATKTPGWALLRDELVAFVSKRVDTRETAEDIVQDIFERLQRTEPGTVRNPQAWLYRSARNATIDHYRTRRQDRSLGDHDLADEPSSDAKPNSAVRELAHCLRPAKVGAMVEECCAVTTDISGAISDYRSRTSSCDCS